MRMAVELNGVVVLVVNGGGASYIYNQRGDRIVSEGPLVGERLLPLLLLWLSKAFTRQPAPSLVEIPCFHCPNLFHPWNRCRPSFV